MAFCYSSPNGLRQLILQLKGKTNLTPHCPSVMPHPSTTLYGETPRLWLAPSSPPNLYSKSHSHWDIPLVTLLKIPTLQIHHTDFPAFSHPLKCKIHKSSDNCRHCKLFCPHVPLQESRNYASSCFWVSGITTASETALVYSGEWRMRAWGL